MQITWSSQRVHPRLHYQTAVALEPSYSGALLLHAPCPNRRSRYAELNSIPSILLVAGGIEWLLLDLGAERSIDAMHRYSPGCLVGIKY